MDAYIWEKGVVKSGADNTVSCLYLDLVRPGVINAKKEANQQHCPLKHPAIATNNCSSRNKNKTVIKLCC